MKVFMMMVAMAVLTATQSLTVYTASYYGGHHHGRRTASGEVFDKNKMTCAAVKKYKFGERLKVTNTKNGKSVVVTVNDRGGFAKYGREIDLSEGAFKQIAPLKQGLVKVNIQRL